MEKKKDKVLHSNEKKILYYTLGVVGVITIILVIYAFIKGYF